MKIRLIIDGREADLKEDGLVLLTYQSTDAEHPAAVKNSYSQNITLPATPANDAIFSHILRSDFRTAGGFNPLARTPFEIRSEAQEVLVSGYLKLNGGEPGRGYEISLFGGLGGFFYSLMYRSDGAKRTLADMAWKTGGVWQDAEDITIGVSAEDIAYIYTHNLSTAPITFAPFIEGKPKDFDCNKMYYKPGSGGAYFEELKDEVTDGVKTYRPKNGTGRGILVEFSNEHDAWAMQEFRNTQQRPLWSVKAFLDAVCYAGNNGGYAVTIDPAFLDSAIVRKGWVTLKNGWKPEDGLITYAELLADTQSPADYLLSLAKICGLMFVYDDKGKTIQILTRNSYYGAHHTKRLALEGILAEDKGKTITPILTEDKWQVLSAETWGGRAADFEERKRRKYGSLWIDTAYEFGGNENDILSESVFKGAADVLATSIDYRMIPAGMQTALSGSWYLKFSATDTIKYNLYTAADARGEQQSKDFAPDYGADGFKHLQDVFYNADTDFALYGELPEFQGAEGDAEDGTDVLLFYAKHQTIPNYSVLLTTYPVHFYVTEESAEMLELNGGKPCWDISGGIAVNSFPVFQRQLAEADSDPISFQFARPGEFFTPNEDYINAVPPEGYLGERAWKKWLADRCDVDGRRMRCWVDLRSGKTPKVDAELLRYFWSYGGAVWVLDKINSHSVTTDDLTECEFVKVGDIRNYVVGQSLTESGNLLTADAEPVLTIDGENVKVNG